MKDSNHLPSLPNENSCDLTEQRICLETTFPWLAGVLLPHHVPSSAATLSQGAKAIGLHCQTATIPRLEGIPQADFRYLIVLDCS